MTVLPNAPPSRRGKSEAAEQVLPKAPPSRRSKSEAAEQVDSAPGITAAFEAFAATLQATCEVDGAQAAETIFGTLSILAAAEKPDAKAAIDDEMRSSFGAVPTHVSDAFEKLKETVHEATRKQLRAQATTAELKLATMRTAAERQLSNSKVEFEAKLSEKITAISSGDGSLLKEMQAEIEALSARLDGATQAARTKEEQLRSAEKRKEELEARMASLGVLQDEVNQAMQAVTLALRRGKAPGEDREPILVDLAYDEPQTLLGGVGDLVGAYEASLQTIAQLELELAKRDHAIDNVERRVAFEREMHAEEAGARKEVELKAEQVAIDLLRAREELATTEASSAKQLALLRAEVEKRDAEVEKLKVALREVRNLEGNLEGSGAGQLFELQRGREEQEKLVASLAGQVERLSGSLTEARAREEHVRSTAEQLRQQLQQLSAAHEALAAESAESARLLERTMVDLGVTKKENRTLAEQVRDMVRRFEALRNTSEASSMHEELFIIKRALAEALSSMGHLDAETDAENENLTDQLVVLVRTYQAAQAALEKANGSIQQLLQSMKLLASEKDARIRDIEAESKRERAALVTTALQALSGLSNHLTHTLTGMRTKQSLQPVRRPGTALGTSMASLGTQRLRVPSEASERLRIHVQLGPLEMIPLPAVVVRSPPLSARAATPRSPRVALDMVHQRYGPQEGLRPNSAVSLSHKPKPAVSHTSNLEFRPGFYAVGARM